MPYKAIPTFRQSVGYGELKQVLGPRWYLAVRGGYTSANEGGNSGRIETAAGFRVNRLQLIKADYEYEHHSVGTQQSDNVFAIQFITTLHKGVGRD